MERETDGSTEGAILPTGYLLRGRGGNVLLASALLGKKKRKSQPAKTVTPIHLTINLFVDNR